MNRLNARIVIGAALVLTGLLMLIERFGILPGLNSIVWGLIFIAGGVYFLYRFIQNTRFAWWAAIPAFALLGIGTESVLSSFLPAWGGFFFLSALGLGFFAVYLSDRSRWWAIIPGGVLISLASSAILSSAFGIWNGGSVALIGFGLTFLLVALLASLQWAWIPGTILLVLGALTGTPLRGLDSLIWPAALILGGLLLILQFARKH